MSAGSATDIQWRPHADAQALCRRAEILREVREFFHRRNLLEVQTSVLGTSGVSDPAIASLRTVEADYLQTSPEYQMKRLLSAYNIPIYQICPAFRGDESGKWHAREFTMLEWYRPGFTTEQLRAEVQDLVDLILGRARHQSSSFIQLVSSNLGIDVGRCLDNEAELLELASAHGLINPRSGRDALDFLFSQAISRTEGRWFVIDYPPELAALSRIADRNGVQVADRFELIIDGIEIANGYNELSDPDELLHRIARDNDKRSELGLENVPVDHELISAMRHGLPFMSGVALGLDRLIALAMDKQSIAEVMAFPNG